VRSTETAGAGGAGGTPGTGAGTAAAGPSQAILRTATAPTVSGLDFDADAVGDAADACPGVPGGPADADGDGCPEAPESSIAGGPAENGFATSRDASFALGSSESGSTFTCSLDGRAGAPCPSPTRLTALSSTTHVLDVWAHDAAGDSDATPATRTWTVPLDDKTLKHSAGWTQAQGSGYYLNTYSTTKRRGATLSTRATNVRRVALVASTGPGFGTVTVMLGSSKLRTVKLASSRPHKRQVLPIATLSAARSGTLKVVVNSSAKTVRIEGLGVATR
jgi:hypothetical protein